MIKELKDSDANPLIGLTVGQETDASLVGFGRVGEMVTSLSWNGSLKQQVFLGEARLVE